jgi:2-polyprenyl-3-methyl-5-hydroxy-6-metoxy-1,4-benzoquinol methylase
MLPLHHAQYSVFNYEEIPAGYYYRVMHEGSPPQRFWHLEKFREVASRVPKGARLLDFGCGPGSFLDVVGKERPDVTAIGVDIAGRQIDFAEQNIGARYEKDRIHFRKVAENEEHLPFDSESFDVVTSIEVIEHIHPYHAIRFLLEARRLLKPGGLLLVTTPNYRSLWPLIERGLEHTSPVKYHDQHISKFTPNAFVKFLETAGFDVKRTSSIFVLAPFLAHVPPLARLAFAAEKSVNHMLGSLLVGEAVKLNDLH